MHPPSLPPGLALIVFCDTGPQFFFRRVQAQPHPDFARLMAFSGSPLALLWMPYRAVTLRVGRCILAHPALT
jgi:hypothetical protein